MENKENRELEHEELNKVSGGAGRYYPEYYVTNECICCGTCEDECPVGAISMADGFAFINQDSCVICGSCADVCPVGAIRER